MSGRNQIPLYISILLLSASGARFGKSPWPGIALVIPHFARIPATAASQVRVVARPVRAAWSTRSPALLIASSPGHSSATALGSLPVRPILLDGYLRRSTNIIGGWVFMASYAVRVRGVVLLESVSFYFPGWHGRILKRVGRYIPTVPTAERVIVGFETHGTDVRRGIVPSHPFIVIFAQCTGSFLPGRDIYLTYRICLWRCHRS